MVPTTSTKPINTCHPNTTHAHRVHLQAATPQTNDASMTRKMAEESSTQRPH